MAQTVMAVYVVKHPVADTEDDPEDVGIIVEGDTSGTQRCRLCPTVCNHLWPEPELQYPTDQLHFWIHSKHPDGAWYTQAFSQNPGTQKQTDGLRAFTCVVTWRLFSVLKYVVFVIPLTRAVFVLSNSATVFILFFPNCCVYTNSLSW